MPLTFDSLGTDARPYVLGLRWRDLSDRSDLKRLLGELGGTAGVLLESVDRPMVGIAIPEQGRSPRALGVQGKTSAAALLALSTDDRLVFARGTVSGQLWVCAVNNGIVDDRTDIVLDVAIAERLISDLLSEALETGQVMRIVLSEADELSQRAVWFGSTEQQPFSALIDSNQGSRARVKQLVSSLVGSRVLFWVVIAAVVGGMVLYKQRRDRQAVESGAVPAMDPVEAERLRTERIISVVSQALHQDGSTAVIAESIAACRGRLTSIQGFTGAWAGSKGTCDASSVQLVLQRPTPAATIGKGVAAGKEAGADVAFGITEGDMSWNWPVRLDRRPLPDGMPPATLPELRTWLMQLPEHKQLLTTYYTAAQQVMFAYSDQAQIGPATPKGLQFEDPEPTAASGQPVMAPVPSEYSYQTVSITLTTPALGRLDGLIQKASPHWWLSVERVDATPTPQGWRYSVRLRALVR